MRCRYCLMPIKKSGKRWVHIENNFMIFIKRTVCNSGDWVPVCEPLRIKQYYEMCKM